MTTASKPAARAADLFEETLAWLRDCYHDHVFSVERDLVWTIQTRLRAQIVERSELWSLYNDYPMLPGPRRSLSADLAICDQENHVLLAAEFKYEPSHRRADVLPNKLPVIGWADALRDIERIKEFVEREKAEIAYAILVDEGSHFRGREPHKGSRWIDWKSEDPQGHSVCILWARWPSDSADGTGP